MDDMMESFGSEIGPHFWITTQEIEAERAEYLLAHYAIHTIQVKPYDFAAQAALLEQLCREGRAQAEGHTFVVAAFALSWNSVTGAPQSCSLRAMPLDVPSGVAADVARLPGLPSERYVALGINLRRNADGGLLPGSMLNACSKYAELDWALDKPFAATGGVLERSVKCATRTPAMEAAGARRCAA
jgi:hypothetical protein